MKSDFLTNLFFRALQTVSIATMNVPLLLPVAISYGIDPVHFGVIFLAVMEMGFLCPPAGMNIFFASAMFRKPIREIAVSVLPALLAIFLGALAISWMPWLATGLPELFAR